MRLRLLAALVMSFLFLEGCDSHENWETLVNAAQLQMDKKELDVAEKLLLSAYDEPTHDTWLGKDKVTSLASSFGHLGLLYHMEQCQFDKSVQNYSRALIILKDNDGHFALKNQLWHEFAGVKEDQGELLEAEKFLQQAAKFQEKVGTWGHSARDEYESLSSLWALGRIQLKLEKYNEAESIISRELKMMEKDSEGSFMRTWSAYTRANLAEVYRGQGRYAEAEAQFKNAIAAMERTGNAAYSALGPALENYAKTLKSVGRESETAEILIRAKEIHAAQHKMDHLNTNNGMAVMIDCSRRVNLADTKETSSAPDSAQKSGSSSSFQ